MKKLTAIALAILFAAPVAAEEVDRTLDAASDGTVHVSNIAGSVAVDGWNRSEVRVEGTLGRDVEERGQGAGSRGDAVPAGHAGDRGAGRQALLAAQAIDLVGGVGVGRDVEVEQPVAIDIADRGAGAPGVGIALEAAERCQAHGDEAVRADLHLRLAGCARDGAGRRPDLPHSR